ncbi:helix-turn-helix domain-containing protein [Rubellicoccus peritrichatus]|uniref:Helix-turn-helix domain-containing protein n=1 Tax=Rubellicoccus peritrichatus TaxID=3080537 RepID=A0AAQ3L8K1_9BACT|nr:helix-turn-helix domain-containing protein [Puniceicoccus sp. CR14]WOO40662.1 helix-turn-helix domain-containing protein [Puniceicoccus sp. CR14]
MAVRAENPHFVSTGIGDHNQELPNRVHRPSGFEYWMVEYTLLGKAAIDLGNRTHYFDEFDLLLVHPGTPQFYKIAAGVERWYHYWICFHPRPDWLPLMEWQEISPGMLTLKLDDKDIREKVRQCCAQIIDVAHGPLPRRHFLAMSLLEQLLLWCDSVSPSSETNRMDSRIQKAMAFLCAHYRERIGLEQVAAAAGLSVSRLAHLFTEQAGLSPMQYLEKHRIEMARQRLAVTTEPVSAVAEWVGYDSPSYFTKVFREATGYSPRDFRKSHSGESLAG